MPRSKIHVATEKSDSIPADKAEEFRVNAQEAMNEADRTQNPEGKKRWLKVGQDWLRLAERIESKR